VGALLWPDGPKLLGRKRLIAHSPIEPVQPARIQGTAAEHA